MPESSIEAVTPATLAEFCAVQSPADPEYPARPQARLDAGALDWAQLVLLRSPRGKMGTALLSRPPAPIFPHLHADAPPELGLNLYRHLHAWAASQEPPCRLIVQTDFAPHQPEALTGAGWHLSDHSVIYRTDLNTFSHASDPAASERPLTDLLTPAFERFYAPIHALDPGERGRPMREVLEGHARRTDGVLVVVEDGGALVGAATAAWVPMPGGLTANVGMLGVAPEARGQGWGRRLHASALAVGARRAGLHMGGTAADNTPMRRILEANGARLLNEQFDYLP